MKYLTALSFVLGASTALVACGGPAPSTSESKPVTEAEPATVPVAGGEENAYAETAQPTTLSPITLAPYTVRSEYLGELSRGHFNLYIEGGEAPVVRAWVGDEAASNSLVTRAEFEVDHHCAHMEMPEPLPDGAQLWVELETPSGERLKGSTPLQ